MTDEGSYLGDITFPAQSSFIRHPSTVFNKATAPHVKLGLFSASKLHELRSKLSSLPYLLYILHVPMPFLSFRFYIPLLLKSTKSKITIKSVAVSVETMF